MRCRTRTTGSPRRSGRGGRPARSRACRRTAPPRDGSGSSRGGSGRAARAADSRVVAMDEPSLLTSWSFDALQLAPVLIAAFAYGTRVRTLRRRGTAVPAWRVAVFSLGVALLVLAFASPV